MKPINFIQWHSYKMLKIECDWHFIDAPIRKIVENRIRIMVKLYSVAES